MPFSSTTIIIVSVVNIIDIEIEGVVVVGFDRDGGRSGCRSGGGADFQGVHEIEEDPRGGREEIGVVIVIQGEIREALLFRAVKLAEFFHLMTPLGRVLRWGLVRAVEVDLGGDGFPVVRAEVAAAEGEPLGLIAIYQGVGFVLGLARCQELLGCCRYSIFQAFTTSLRSLTLMD